MRSRLFIFFLFLSIPLVVNAQESSTLTAKAVAVYGWKDGVETPIYVKNENRLYPIASLTKLITAKAVESFYAPDTTFTISSSAAKTPGTVAGIDAGATFTRDDLLQALLVRSSNDAATAFAERVGYKKFLARMNTILHTNNYTHTSFINPSGLDPLKKTHLPPNRMTAYNVSRLLSDIYRSDPLLSKIMSQPTAEIMNLSSNDIVSIRNTNSLFRDDQYKDKVLMSKTGLTNKAGQNLAFIAPGNGTYDYITVVLFGSKSRANDGRYTLDYIVGPINTSPIVASAN